MTEKYNEATNNRPEGDRPIDARFVLADIENYIDQLKEEKAWKKNDRNAITLFKSTGITIVLVALHKNATINPHSIDGVTCLHLLKGELTVDLSGESIDVDEEQLITLHPQTEHTITANKKSFFLLTVTGNYGNELD